MFYPVKKDTDSSNGVEILQKLVFLFLLPFAMHLSGFDFSGFSNFFLNPYDGQIGHFELTNSLKNLCNINYSIIFLS